MSVSFQATRHDPERNHQMPIWTCGCTGFCQDCYLHAPNLANSNARDVLSWLGLEDQYLCGEIKAIEFKARCMRRLWDEPRNHDPGLSADERTRQLGIEPSDRIRTQARPPGYIRAQVARLLEIAEYGIREAGEEAFVSWG